MNSENRRFSSSLFRPCFMEEPDVLQVFSQDFLLAAPLFPSFARSETRSFVSAAKENGDKFDIAKPGLVR